jgi:hypothetical protein
MRAKQLWERLLGSRLRSHAEQDGNGLDPDAFPQHAFPLIDPASIRRKDLIYPADAGQYEELKKQRGSVQRQLTKELDALLLPLGYLRSNSEWRKVSPYGRSYFYFQKSRYGFGCFFNAGTLGTMQAPLVANTEDGIQTFRIVNFCPELPHNDVADELSYERLATDIEFRDGVMTIVRARIVPWLEARHRLASTGRMPSPEDMVKIAIFKDFSPMSVPSHDA